MKIDQKILFFLGFLLLLGIVFRSLILNLSSSLIDWRDYALMNWVISQNISNILNGNFSNFFTTLSLYPNQNTLFFSDLLIPQSLIALPFFLVSKQIILSFNILFFITFTLNFISVFLFWRIIFKKDFFAFFASLLFIFSPFFHLNISHFQMLNYWPFFFGMYFFIRSIEEQKIKFAFITGVFLTIQFLASVYLSVYLMTALGVFAATKVSSKNYRQVLSYLILVFVVFALSAGIFIKGYFDTKREYSLTRNINEYIQYSSHLTDYIFNFSVNSLLTNSQIMQKWNSFNKNVWGGHSAFPGVLIFITSILGMFIFIKDKKSISLVLNLDRQKTFFFSLVLIGFIFSLGPRLNVNGNYAHIPLPYLAALKTIPIFESIRVTSRWNYLFYLGIVYFAILGLQKISNNKYRNFILSAAFILFFIESIPVNFQTSGFKYIDENTLVLKNICEQDKKVLLELPVTHLDAKDNIVDGLTYITTTQLAVSEHRCYLVNGYSGYDLPGLLELSDKIDQAIDSNDGVSFIQLIKNKRVEIVEFNDESFPKLRAAKLQNFYKTLKDNTEIEEISPSIYRVNY